MKPSTRVQLKRALVAVHDLVVTGAVWVLAFLLRWDFRPPPTLWPLIEWSLPTAMLVFGASYRFAGLYQGIWRYASIPDMVRIVRAVVIGNFAMLAIVFLVARGEVFPRSVLIINPLILVIGLGTSRLAVRLLKMRRERQTPANLGTRRKMLLIGAGDAAEVLVRDSMRPEASFAVVGLLDDDRRKLGLRIHGAPVLGVIDALPAVIESLREGDTVPEEVVIAIPSATPDAMRCIVAVCERSGLPYRTVPGLDDLVTGRVRLDHLRKVTIEDILGRARVRLDEQAIHRLIAGKSVMVTGGGGSIGSELCRQIARFEPSRLILYEQSEYNLYRIDMELGRVFPEVPRISVLGDTRDEARVRWTIATYEPEIVLHAAAYKHVPLVELNPVEGILTNILGTKTVANACVDLGVARFVMVSTDKAVNPTNVMGASKRLAEIYCQNQEARKKTDFITVRFGNVLGSVGSVVPLFEEQIRMGGPVTVTHPDMTRYFMTIPEASQLILQAATMGQGGEIFVLDMGAPVRIVDLAGDMIRLSGKEVGKDIQIVFTGLRPGEKLREELLYDDEALASGGHEKIFLAHPQIVALDWLEQTVQHLIACCRNQDAACAQRLLQELVPEYRPDAPAASRGAAPVPESEPEREPEVQVAVAR